MMQTLGKLIMILLFREAFNIILQIMIGAISQAQANATNRACVAAWMTGK
jgi:hypothetical protein